MSMGLFSLENSNLRAWLLLVFGNQRQYAGNLGYADDFSTIYEYDSFVGNYRQISEGDLAVLQEPKKLLGIARIERIDAFEGTKQRRRCPICRKTTLKQRKDNSFRCFKCAHIFDTPIKENVTCTLFTAHFGDSFVPAQEALSIEALRHACPRYNEQLSMQLLEFKRIEALLIAQVPDVKQLLTTHSNLGYLKADDAACIEINENPNATPYSPITGDRRQVLMRQIRERRGQSKFRQTLRSRYGNQCMITGCQLLDIVEAAHISPYRGFEDNHPENGLLLRADLHTLFDLDLLGIHPKSLQVHFHPVAIAAGYQAEKNQKLLCSEMKPSEEALESRWSLFLRRLQSKE